MEKLSVKIKLVILILLICSFVLLINNNAYAAWYTPVERVELDSYQRNLWLNGSGYVQLKATVYPRDAGIQTIKWSSSNSNVATVDQNRKSNR